MTDPAPHLFWITSRAAGGAALLLTSLAVGLGLLMSGRGVRGRALELRTAHEAVALAAMAAIVVHAAALLGDGFLHPSVADVTVPFASGYKTIWTTMGIVAGWGTILLGLAFYARRWIGAQRWRALHSFTALAWVLGVGHSLGEGTDAGRLWFLAMTGLAVVPVAALMFTRALAHPAPPASTAPAVRAGTPVRGL